MTPRKQSIKQSISVTIPKSVLYPILISLLGSMGFFYVKTETRLTKSEINYDNLMQANKSVIEKVKSMNNKMEPMSNDIAEIKGYLKQRKGECN